MKIYTRYDTPEVCGIKISTPSMTQQQFKEDCDINVILQRYSETGILGDPFAQSTRTPMYGDYTNVPDLREAYDIFAKADEDFMSLPSEVRKEFDNSPYKFLQFMSDPNNLDRAIELGLAYRKTEQINEPQEV